jgi:hypothetical protein
LTEARKPRAVEIFEERHEQAKRARLPFEKQWKRFENVYHGTTELPTQRDGDKTRSRLRIPWVYQLVETMAPRLIDPEPVFAYFPVQPMDEVMAQVLNTLVKFQLNADRFVARQKSWIDDGAIRALGIAKVVWVHEERNMRVRRQNNPLAIAMGRGVYREEEQTVTVTNRPSILYIDPEDFFWDPAAVSDETMEWATHRVWLSAGQIRRRERQGVYSGVDKIGSPSGSADSNPRDPKETSEEARYRRANRYEVFEHWDKVSQKVTTICNGVVLREEDWPYLHGELPFVTFCTMPNRRSLVGISECEKLADPQDAIWTTDNQRIEAVSISLSPMMILDPMLKGQKNLSFKKGGRIYANTQQRVEQMRIDPNIVPAFEQTQSYLDAMHQVSGVDPAMMVDSSQQMSDSATGAMLRHEETNMRMMMKKLQFRLFEAKIAKLMVQLNHQFLTKAEIRRIVGDKAKDMKVPDPTEIPMFLDVIPKGMSESLNKGVERNSQAEIINSLAGIHLAPMGDGSAFTLQPQIRRLIESYDQDPSMGNFIPVEAAAQAQMIMGGGGGMPGGGMPPTAPPQMVDQVGSMSDLDESGQQAPAAA